MLQGAQDQAVAGQSLSQGQIPSSHLPDHSTLLQRLVQQLTVKPTPTPTAAGATATGGPSAMPSQQGHGPPQGLLVNQQHHGLSNIPHSGPPALSVSSSSSNGALASDSPRQLLKQLMDIHHSMFLIHSDISDKARDAERLMSTANTICASLRSMLDDTTTVPLHGPAIVVPPSFGPANGHANGPGLAGFPMSPPFLTQLNHAHRHPVSTSSSPLPHFASLHFPTQVTAPAPPASSNASFITAPSSTQELTLLGDLPDTGDSERPRALASPTDPSKQSIPGAAANATPTMELEGTPTPHDSGPLPPAPLAATASGLLTSTMSLPPRPPSNATEHPPSGRSHRDRDYREYKSRDRYSDRDRDRDRGRDRERDYHRDHRSSRSDYRSSRSSHHRSCGDRGRGYSRSRSRSDSRSRSPSDRRDQRRVSKSTIPVVSDPTVSETPGSLAGAAQSTYDYESAMREQRAQLSIDAQRAEKNTQKKERQRQMAAATAAAKAALKASKAAKKQAAGNKGKSCATSGANGKADKKGGKSNGGSRSSTPTIPDASQAPRGALPTFAKAANVAPPVAPPPPPPPAGHILQIEPSRRPTHAADHITVAAMASHVIHALPTPHVTGPAAPPVRPQPTFFSFLSGSRTGPLQGGAEDEDDEPMKMDDESDPEDDQDPQDADESVMVMSSDEDENDDVVEIVGDTRCSPELGPQDKVGHAMDATTFATDGAFKVSDSPDQRDNGIEETQDEDTGLEKEKEKIVIPPGVDPRKFMMQVIRSRIQSKYRR